MIWLKRLWRGAMAVKNVLALIALLLFFGTLFTLLSSSANPADARGGALLLDLRGTIVEQPEAVDPMTALAGDQPLVSQLRGRDVIRALETAAGDSKIKAVALDLDSFVGAGQVILEDVARAIDKVRAAEKPVLAFATAYSDDSYLLAAHASEVWLDPAGDVILVGPGGSQPYFKGLIDRLGVNVHVYKVGKFKSAVEPYLLAGQSAEARQANQALADTLFEGWKANVGKARPKAKLQSPLGPRELSATEDLSDAALKNGLVDRLGDRIAFGKHVAKLVGGDEDKGLADFNRSTLDAYLAANPEQRGGNVGIVTVAGGIVDGNAPAGMAGGDSIAALIERAVTQEKVKALVIRIDSPGGSSFASENIRRAIAETKARKIPVIVSMGNVAASGGYWIAMGGDLVFAEPSTITGSIGVFGIIPTFENTLARYGVTGDGVRTTPYSGQPDILRGTTPETDRYLQTGVDNTYRQFLKLVSGARKLPVARVDEIAQGRVWDGGTARQLGLIDTFGSLGDAVAEAAKRAGIEVGDIKAVHIDPPQAFLSALASSFVMARVQPPVHGGLSMMAHRERLRLAGGISDAAALLSGPVVQSRCLACPSLPAQSRLKPDLTPIFSRIFK